MKFYTNIELNKNQIKDVVIDQVTSLPATGAVEGQFVYLNTATATEDVGLYVYNGTAWKPVAFGTTFYPIFPPEKTTPEAADFIPGDTLLRDSSSQPDLDRGVWICKTKHSVTTTTKWIDEDDPTKSDKQYWELLESNTFKGEYAVNTNYAPGNIVTWGNATYLCHTGCTSHATDISAGPDPTKWHLLGANYRGVYNGDIWPTTTPTAATTKSISKGDVVSYGGVTYLCKTGYSFTFTPPVSSTNPYPPTFDDTKYVALGGGDVYKGGYDTSVTYSKGDIVYHENQLFHCNTDGATGTWDATKWDLLLSDDWRGAFEATGGTKTKDYVPGEKVSYNGDLYVCIADTDNAAWDSDDWSSIATNIEFFDASKDYKAGVLVKTGTVDAVTGVYIAADDIAAGAFDATKWHSLYNDYRGEWNKLNNYKIGDEVKKTNGTETEYYIAIVDQTGGSSVVWDADKWYKLGNAQYRGAITEVDGTDIKLTASVEYGDIFTDGTNILEATARFAKGTVIGTTGATGYRDYTNLRFFIRQKVEVELQKDTTSPGTAAVVGIVTIPYGCIVEEVETGIIDASTTPNTKTPVIVEKLYTDEVAASHTGAKIQFTATLTSTATEASEKITCSVYYR